MLLAMRLIVPLTTWQLVFKASERISLQATKSSTKTVL